MGAWSEESYSNDDVWDALSKGGRDPRRIGQVRVNVLVSNLFLSDKRDETKLGVTVFFLLRGMKVPREHLEGALKMARKLAGTKKYLREWVEPRKREAMLVWEAGQIERALAHGCRGRKAYFAEDILANFAGGGK